MFRGQGVIILKILGIDVATKITGWGLVDEHGAWWHGVIDYSEMKDVPARLMLLGDNIKELIRLYKPDIVAVEDQFFGRNIDTLKKLSQARGVVEFVSLKCNCDVMIVSNKTAKKVMTGNGNAKKKMVQDAVIEKFKLPIDITEDEADAIAIAYTALVSSA